jgi:SAM-dependent methyltransferase
MKAPDYLQSNQAYWEKGYHAPNVDHCVFRFFGRILKPDFRLPQNHESLLDFGCGQGAAVNYFCLNGFNAFGTDISHADIGVAQARYPHIASRFSTCALQPAANPRYGPQDAYRVITAIQSLYYFSRDHFAEVMAKLYAQLEPGGVFFATMMGTQSKEYYDNSSPTDDPWLRRVAFDSPRFQVRDYFMFFIEDEADLKAKFRMFRPVHVGYYAAKFRSDEGDGLHFTFCGVKD